MCSLPVLSLTPTSPSPRVRLRSVSGRPTMGRPRMRSDSCLLLQMPATRPSSALGRTISTLPVVVALMLLPTAAFASPPDPSWIAGVYDGSDGDDIVTLVCETTAANTTARPHLVSFPCRPDVWLKSAVPCSPGRLARSSRSPPLVLCGVCSCPPASAISAQRLGSIADNDTPAG